MMGIYSITNKINNKIYVGQTIDIDRRWKQHRLELNKKRHRNNHLQNAWNKYGEGNFEFKILEVVLNEKELNQKEMDYIKEYKANNMKFGYNLTDGGEGGTISEEVKQKISKTLRGTKSNLSPDDVRHIKMALYCLMDRKELSKMFNTSEKNLTQISNGKSFAYIQSDLNDSIHNLKQKLIDERNEYILNLFDNGSTITEIAKQTEYSTSIIEKCVYKYRNVVKETSEKYQKIYEEVFKLHNLGMIDFQIAKKLKISASTVSRYLKHENNPYNELPFKKITNNIKDDVLKMYFEEKKSSTEIAENFHISSTTVMSFINNYKYANTEVSL